MDEVTAFLDQVINHLPVIRSKLRPFLGIKQNAKERFTGSCLFREDASEKLRAANRQDQHEEVHAYGERDPPGDRLAYRVH